jgi:hypothetical protein
MIHFKLHFIMLFLMLKTKNKKFFMYPDHHGHTQLLKMPEVENEMDNI